MPRKTKRTTTAPVQAGDFTGAAQEFGRWQDVQRQYGIKRGSLYGLLALGKVKGCLLRVRGQKSGIRLIDMASVRDYIRQCQAEQEAA
jgi:hypothetical protein